MILAEDTTRVAACPSERTRCGHNDHRAPLAPQAGPAQFTPLFRKNDQPGDMIEGIGDELQELSPMEVSFDAGENASEVVPVSFETVVTETGMLQLWCISRDGRRWKLEFNVRERVEG